MKRLLLSLMTIALVAGGMVYGTRAFFFDTETSTGNTFSTGTIDIAVNGENPWLGEGYFDIVDMKPSDAQYKDFTINNVGNNEVDVWKHIDVTGFRGGLMTEPECEAESGQWDGSSCSANSPVDDISQVILYDLLVDGEEIIIEDYGIMMGAVNSYWVYLGKIEPGQNMGVVQSYHMAGDTGNKYQGDELDFTVELYAQQIRGCPSAPGDQLPGYEKPAGDYVDFGDPMSERGHLNKDADDWSYVGSQSCTDPSSCLKLGRYGGYDPGDSSNDFRGLMGPDTGCGDGHYHATLVMNACEGEVTTLTLRHLDGSQNDSFEVFFLEDGTWTEIGHYDWQDPTEDWVTTSYELPGPRSGKLEFKLVATSPVGSWCDAGWGQVMFNWASVE